MRLAHNSLAIGIRFDVSFVPLLPGERERDKACLSSRTVRAASRLNFQTRAYIQNALLVKSSKPETVETNRSTDHSRASNAPETAAELEKNDDGQDLNLA